MITYHTNNLFDDDAACIVNPVNCVGVMGKGLALEFKRRFPDMFTTYRKLCESGDLCVGQIVFYRHLPSNRVICLFPTKDHWRQPSTLEIIERGLKQFVRHAAKSQATSFAFPALGCGLGGLSFTDHVRPLMEKYLTTTPFDIRIYHPERI